MGNCVGESNVWRFILFLLISIVDIGGYMLQLIMVLQSNPTGHIHRFSLASLLLSLFLLLLFDSLLLVRTTVLRSCGMTYLNFKKKFSESRDSDDEIVIYIP